MMGLFHFLGSTFKLFSLELGCDFFLKYKIDHITDLSFNGLPLYTFSGTRQKWACRQNCTNNKITKYNTSNKNNSKVTKIIERAKDRNKYMTLSYVYIIPKHLFI